MEHWKELLVGVGLTVAGAVGGMFTMTVAHQTTIERIEDDVTYLRDRVDAIYDRLPERGAQ